MRVAKPIQLSSNNERPLRILSKQKRVVSGHQENKLLQSILPRQGMSTGYRIATFSDYLKLTSSSSR